MLSNLPERWRDYAEFFFLCGMFRSIRNGSRPDIDGHWIGLRAENVKNRRAHSVPLTGQLAKVIARRRLTSPKTY